jgi:hypothetical protein
MKFIRNLKAFAITLLFIFTFNPFSINSQENTKGPEIFFSPRITLGYTLGSGFNYGFDLFLGVYRLNEFRLGADFSWYVVNTGQGIHQIKGIGLVGETDYLSMKLGAGSVSRSWGRKNVNKARTPGIMIDVALGLDAYTAPWLGFKTFLFRRENWMFYEQAAYLSAYSYFKSNDIIIRKFETEAENQ